MRNDFFLSSSPGISAQIKRAIGYRILVCFFLGILAVLAITLTEIASSSHQFEKNIEEQCSNLDSFAVSQVLIRNEDSIQPKLDALNKKSDKVIFTWRNADFKLMQKKLHWYFPLSWTYVYPVNNLDGTPLGAFVVKGSMLYDHGLLSDLLTKVGLLLLFFTIIAVVLNPLGKRIPQQLFITPINNLLSLLRSGKSSATSENFQELPEEINEIRQKITAMLKDAEARSREAALGQIATQVAHDIRSPLLVLKRVLNDLSSLPEKKRIDAYYAIQRVTDIANNLLSQYRQEKNHLNTPTTLTQEPAAIMLESIVSEKRIQLADSAIEIELNILAGAQNVFIYVDIAEFKRVLSNLINNSIEAIKDQKGRILLTLGKNEGKAFITVKDNGCGIPKDKLPFVLEEGGSFGKKQGSGLGLPYAVNKISEWHGDYSLKSVPGEGTQFEIVLPEARPPEWFRSEISLSEGSAIVVLDDDEYIHEIWRERFSEAFLQTHQIKLFHFNNHIEFILFCREHQFEKIIFLLDYELGNYKENGLNLAKILDIGSNSTLVTCRYENVEVREKCKALGMKMIPKSFAEITPIRIVTPTEIVFIDDEERITELWKESAETAGKSINIFNDPRDFMRVVYMYPTDTLIYMDSSLGSLKGEDFAKVLHEQGYENIVLATGFPKEQFKNVTWVKDIIGKEPPWG